MSPPAGPGRCMPRPVRTRACRARRRTAKLWAGPRGICDLRYTPTGRAIRGPARNWPKVRTEVRSQDRRCRPTTRLIRWRLNAADCSRKGKAGRADGRRGRADVRRAPGPAREPVPMSLTPAGDPAAGPRASRSGRCHGLEARHGGALRQSASRHGPVGRQRPASPSRRTAPAAARLFRLQRATMGVGRLPQPGGGTRQGRGLARARRGRLDVKPR
jgi:hypothetical protein